MSRNGGASGYLPEIGIPTGLNRIKTRRVELNSDLDQFEDSNDGASISGSYSKQKPEVVSKGHVKLFRSKQGLRKGREISRWFTSSLLKHSDQAEGDLPINEVVQEFYHVKVKGRQQYKPGLWSFFKNPKFPRRPRKNVLEL